MTYPYSAGNSLPASELNADLVKHDGNVQSFDASGTWTKPSGADKVLVQVWGAGGSGASEFSGSPDDAPGGGGGAYAEAWFDADDLGATEAVTVGAGGAGVSGGGGASTAGNDGGNSSFGSHLQANGGKGGTVGTNPDAGGDGGILPNLVAIDGLFGVGANNDAGDGLYSGAGGSSGTNKVGGNSHYGGGGGGGADESNAGAGGASNLAGAGGAGNNAGAGVAGTQPGGGGGGSTNTTSGSGADGRVTVTTFRKMYA